jgi:(p)ppGpp synthase/HD superfamily hydrolase
MSKIIEAIELATECHEGQTRIGGLPYISHIFATAGIVLGYNDMSEKLVISSLLHDTVEDKKITPEEVEKRFGEEILNTIFEVTKQEGKFNIKTTDGAIVKMADRIHNLQCIHSAPKEKIIEYVKKTEELLVEYNNLFEKSHQQMLNQLKNELQTVKGSLK